MQYTSDFGVAVVVLAKGVGATISSSPGGVVGKVTVVVVLVVAVVVLDIVAAVVGSVSIIFRVVVSFSLFRILLRGGLVTFLVLEVMLFVIGESVAFGFVRFGFFPLPLFCFFFGFFLAFFAGVVGFGVVISVLVDGVARVENSAIGCMIGALMHEASYRL